MMEEPIQRYELDYVIGGTPMKKVITFVILAVMLSGCATTYHKRSYTGGYSETQLGENIFKVLFIGNGYTSRERATDFSLLRSSELALENGFKYFIIVDSQEYTKRNSFTTPTTSQTTGSAYVTGNYISGKATTKTTGGQTYVISKPRSTNTIVCFKEKPVVSGVVYEAEFVAKSIRGKYKMRKLSDESNQNVATSSMDAVIANEAVPNSQQNLQSILAQDQNLYFNILKVVRRHVLIQSDSPDDFDIGTTYEIVRGNEANYVEIGRAKVALKKGSTIALKVIQSSGPIQINDRIKYNKYNE